MIPCGWLWVVWDRVVVCLVWWLCQMAVVARVRGCWAVRVWCPAGVWPLWCLREGWPLPVSWTGLEGVGGYHLGLPRWRGSFLRLGRTDAMSSSAVRRLNSALAWPFVADQYTPGWEVAVVAGVADQFDRGVAFARVLGSGQVPGGRHVVSRW